MMRDQKDVQFYILVNVKHARTRDVATFFRSIGAHLFATIFNAVLGISR